MLPSGVHFESARARLGKCGLVVLDHHSEVSVGRGRLVLGHQVNLGAVPLKPHRPTRDSRWGGHFSKAEERVEGNASLELRGGDFSRNVMDHRPGSSQIAEI